MRRSPDRGDGHHITPHNKMLQFLKVVQYLVYYLIKIKEYVMPYGKGTYGKKVGRPKKKVTKKKK